MHRCDLHIHTRYSPDSRSSLESIAARCKQAGLTCIAITDHNAIEGALRLKAFAPFRVIVGEEIMSSGGEIIGLYLKERIPPGLSPCDTVAAIRAQGGLVHIPHPFDTRRSSLGKGHALEDIAHQADILETFNAHCLRQRWNDDAAAFATKHGLVPAAVSDAHAARELGVTYMELPDFEDTPQGLLTALRFAKLVTKRPSPLLRLAPAWTRLRRLVGL